MDYEYEDELERMKRRRQQKSSQTGRRRQSDSGRAYEDEYGYYGAPDGGSRGRGEYGRTGSGRTSESRRRKKRKKKILLAELLLLAVVLLSAVFIFKKVRDDGYWTVAVFGVDSRTGNLGRDALSDVEIIANINKKTGEIKLVSVFRDTYLKIDSKGNYHKINEAYFKGGPTQAVEALNENLDLKIDDYVTFNWKAVADAINILGGIDLELSDKEFKYINSFITETVESTGIYSFHLEHAGANHLDGVQAVAYARLRLMDTDYNRTARQRKVIELAMEKAKAADWSVLNNILVTVFPQVATSVGIDDVIPLARGIGKYHISETDGFPFSRQNMDLDKRDCVVATTLESNVIQLHQFLFGDSDYQPSATVKEISAHIAKVSGLGDPGEPAPPAKAGGNGGAGKEPAKKEPSTEPPESEAPSEEETTEEESSAEEETTTAEESESAEEEREKLGPGAALEETTKAPEESEDGPKETQKQTEAPTQASQSVSPAKPEPSGESEPAGGPGSNGPGGQDSYMDGPGA